MTRAIHNHRGSLLLIAFMASVLVHLSALVVASVVRERGWLFTQFREQWSRAAAHQDAKRDKDEEKTEDEEQLQPGIEHGAPAVISWIGYEDYIEQIAPKAEVDQAAFAYTDTPSDHENARVEPAATVAGGGGAPGDEGAVQEDSARAGEDTAPAEAVNPVGALAEDRESADDARSPVTTADARESVPAREGAVEADAGQTGETPAPEVNVDGNETETSLPLEAQMALSQAIATAKQIERPEEQEQEQRHQLEEPRQDTGESTGRGDAIGDGDAAEDRSGTASEAGGSDKESPATSARKMHDVEWDPGKPLAAEGMEILPYPLFRHIMLDSRDVLFGRELNHGRWDGRVKQNPIVSLRFNRFGQVGEIHIVRKSGFASLDDHYLTSWMSRWRARDARLAKMGEGQLTAPLVLRIGFIKEKNAKEEGQEPGSQSGESSGN